MALSFADSEVVETGGEGANSVDPVWLHRSVRKGVQKGGMGLWVGVRRTRPDPRQWRHIR